MKNLAMLFVFFLVSCTPKIKVTEPKLSDSIVSDSILCIPDTLIINDTVYLPASNQVFEKKYDSLIVVVNKKNDSLFVERYKIERIKYYNKIVQKNKTQLKFLSGWINRVVN